MCVCVCVLICRYNLFPGDQRASGFGVPPASRRTERGGDGMRGHDWGRGQRLD